MGAPREGAMQNKVHSEAPIFGAFFIFTDVSLLNFILPQKSRNRAATVRERWLKLRQTHWPPLAAAPLPSRLFPENLRAKGFAHSEQQRLQLHPSAQCVGALAA